MHNIKHVKSNNYYSPKVYPPPPMQQATLTWNISIKCLFKFYSRPALLASSINIQWSPDFWPQFLDYVKVDEKRRLFRAPGSNTIRLQFNCFLRVPWFVALLFHSNSLNDSIKLHKFLINKVNKCTSFNWVHIHKTTIIKWINLYVCCWPNSSYLFYDHELLRRGTSVCSTLTHTLY